MPDKTDNSAFRLHMYDQAWNNINRHILTVWQSVAAVAAALAAMIFTEKQVLSLDVAVSMVVLFSAWLMAHVYDAQTWYDRNLAIIQDNEKFFETKPGEFHAYTKPRALKLITHLRIQRDLAIALVVLGVGTHICTEAIPVLTGVESAELRMALPYAALLAWCIYAFYAGSEWKDGHRKAYKQD